LPGESGRKDVTIGAVVGKSSLFKLKKVVNCKEGALCKELKVEEEDKKVEHANINDKLVRA
jgi:hypothetical protein